MQWRRLLPHLQLSSSPPPSSHIWYGFFLVCFCHSLGCVFFFFFGLGLFLVSFYKRCDAFSSHCSVSQHTFVCGGLENRINPRNKASPTGFGTGQVEGIPICGEGGGFAVLNILFSAPSPPPLVCLYCVHALAEALKEKFSLENALVSI